MRNMQRIPRLLVFASWLLLSAAPALAAIQIHQVPTDQWQSHEDCGGVTPGGTDILGGGFVRALDLSGSEMQQIWQDINGQFDSAWSYTMGPSLGGDLYIERYYAFDRHVGAKCLHGAEFKARFANVTAPEGTVVDWFQLFKLGGQAQSPNGYPPGPGWIIDPAKDVWIDMNGNGIEDPGERQDRAPFYWNQNEVPDRKILSDAPQQPHPESTPWEGSMTFYLFLATWDGNYTPGQYPHTITIHDGIAWGFSGVCLVPEPGLLGVVIVCGLSVMRGAGKRK